MKSSNCGRGKGENTETPKAETITRLRLIARQIVKIYCGRLFHEHSCPVLSQCNASKGNDRNLPLLSHPTGVSGLKHPRFAHTCAVHRSGLSGPQHYSRHCKTAIFLFHIAAPFLPIGEIANLIEESWCKKLVYFLHITSLVLSHSDGASRSF